MEAIMIIFPAIDIKDGKCVRLVKGDFNQMTSYKKSPFEQAKIYFENGFKNIQNETKRSQKTHLIYETKRSQKMSN